MELALDGVEEGEEESEGGVGEKAVAWVEERADIGDDEIFCLGNEHRGEVVNCPESRKDGEASNGVKLLGSTTGKL